MSLIVSPSTHTSAVPVAQAGALGGAASPSLKWLWVAVGVLGVSVVALGTTLVVQNAGKSAADAQPLAMTAQPASGAPRAENLQQKPAPALVDNRNIATNRVANQPPAASQGYAGHPPQQYQPQQQPPLRTAAQAPLCATCGRVESVQAVQQAAPATGVGAVAGGVLGAVVGNQVGKGSGRTAATVLGAVGGGYVGHKVEERTRTQTVYQIGVTDIGLAEGDHVGVIRRDGIDRKLPVVTVVGDVPAAERSVQRLVVESRGRIRPSCLAFDGMEIAQAELAEFTGEMAISRLRVAVQGCVADRARHGRETHADTIGTPDLRDSGDDLDR